MLKHILFSIDHIGGSIMFLRSLIKNELVTINYYKEGTLYKCKGHVQGLNLAEQTLSLKDQQEKILSIRLSKIMKIS